jgi:2-C-methyl-D-erythritol 2,4-cyclodiphosphate synthase
MKIRVGFGFDVHPLTEGRELWIGGVKIDSDKGALGHSDADVLIHAICDALLGAANLGDIGIHFSNRDPQWKNIDSKILLEKVYQMIKNDGWLIENIDATITLEFPKLNPYIEDMKKTLAKVLNINKDSISIKATTNENMGYVGRREGINAYAVTLLSK